MRYIFGVFIISCRFNLILNLAKKLDRTKRLWLCLNPIFKVSIIFWISLLKSTVTFCVRLLLKVSPYGATLETEFADILKAVFKLSLTKCAFTIWLRLKGRFYTEIFVQKLRTCLSANSLINKIIKSFSLKYCSLAQVSPIFGLIRMCGLKGSEKPKLYCLNS